jgi:hypothetical protein
MATSKRDLELYRDELLRRVKRIVVELDEVIEEIESAGVDSPEFWTPFDVRRTALDLKTGRHCVEGVEDKLLQVGRWAEINKAGSWATVRQRIKKK